MRKVFALLALVAASMYLASYVELNSNIRSGPIVISSMDNVYVFISPDDGVLRLFVLRDLDLDLPAPVWTKDVGSTDGIPSTGAHGYWEDQKANMIFVAPKGKGLQVYGFNYDTTEATTGGTLIDEWDEISGGIAAFRVAQNTDSASIVVAALDEMGYFRAAILHVATSSGNLEFSINSTNGSTKLNLSSGGAYSTLAVDWDKSSSSATVFMGSDEGVHVVELDWSTSDGTVSAKELKTVPISGVAQSGFAIGENYVYFLTYAFDKAYFYVMNKSNYSVKSYTIDVPAGEAVAGYPTNSPVVEKTGTGEIVYVAVGKAVYYYTDDQGLQKYADIGETIYAAPVLVSNSDNPENKTLFVVTGNGKVYKVSYNNPVEIPSPCAGMGQVYTPPIARSGRLIFGVSTPDGNGYLCSVDISSIGSGVPNEGWPAFGYADARSQVKGENPPFKIPVYLKGYFTNGNPLDTTSVEASYAIYEDSTTPSATGIKRFNYIVDVTQNATLEVYASDLILNPCSIVDGTDVHYEFSHWDINGVEETHRSTKVKITESQIWKAYYTKKFKIYVDYWNQKTDSVDSSDSTFVEAGTTVNLENLFAKSQYKHIKWVIQECGSDPYEVESKDATITVNGPVYIKEYVLRTFGKVYLKFPKYLFEPVSDDEFNVVVKIEKIDKTLAGPGATDVKAFYINFDFKDLLPFEVHVKDVVYELNLDYATNVSATTTKIAQVFQASDTGFEYVVALSTPIATASDIFIATITATYTGVERYLTLSDYMKADMVDSGVGDATNTIGVFNVLLSGETDDDKGEKVEYLPDYKGLLGDFVGRSSTDTDGCVDGWDMLALLAHYGLKEGDPDWDPRFDIAPREGFVPPASPDDTTIFKAGYLEPENPRKIDFKDVLIEALMYGYGCTE